ncbi:MAG: CheA signal transduction histidine kinase [Bradyrhizobium sp.]|nr:CheA signal transduction histidine kinase [Bradyrhizobium sp.]
MTTLKDPLRYFRVEAREISEELGRGALQIEKDATPELVARLLRLAHTLKGAASVVKQRAIADHTHALEDALAALREQKGKVPRDAIDLILEQIDAIAAQVAALEPGVAAPALRLPDAPSDEPFSILRTDIAEMDALLDGISEAGVQIRGIRHTVGMVEQARRLADLLADRMAPQFPRGHRGQEGSVSEKTRQFATDLQDLVGGIEQRLKNGLDQSEREIQQARAAAERLRLLPCSAFFASLERAVRDVAQSLGKQADLDIAGGEVRLDAHVLGLVQRVLVQLLRNAVAHGIEMPADRLAAGKPEAGRVEIRIVRRGNRVAFICKDDGAGIDLDAVRRAAEARGPLPPAARRDDAGYLLELLLEGGLSTSRTVTELSGRGVGLDVVREIATQLGGEVGASTQPGRGTSIELVVPVSLSSLDALLVEAGGRVATLPVAAVHRTLRLAPGAIARTADGESIVHDGKVILFVPLARSMGATMPAAPSMAAKTAVVIRGASSLVAFGVDRLLGAANVVVRPVPPLAFADPVVAGVCLDPEGVPQAVLDPDELVKAALGASGLWEREPAERPAPILVIDDSLTTRVLEQSILESAGYEVDLATSAEEALEMAQRRRYGLFLVDVEMPGMDGFTFVEQTRADPDLRAIPAILVTSRAASEDRQRGIDAGARAYIVKSEFDQGKVLETIRGLLG